MDAIFNILPFLAFAGVAVFLAWFSFSKRGKGLMLGGTIIDTCTEEIVQKTGMLTTAIRVHVVETKNKDKLVGLEISENRKLGVSFKTVKLTKTEAEKLARMISETANKT